MKNYEIVIMLHPDAEVDLPASLSKLKNILTKDGGKIAAHEDWGKRKLAYPIARQQYAVYELYRIKIDPKLIGEIERALVNEDTILRHMITQPEPAAKTDKKLKVASKTKAPDNKKQQKTLVKER